MLGVFAEFETNLRRERLHEALGRVRGTEREEGRTDAQGTGAWERGNERDDDEHEWGL